MQNAPNCIRSAWRRYITKTLLVTKLHVILLTVGFLNICATGLSQNISFSGKEVPLQTVFSAVEKQTGFLFMYMAPVLKSSTPVTVNAVNIPLAQFLSEVFKSQPLKYNIKGKNIFISAKPVMPGSSGRQPSNGTADLLKDTSIDIQGWVINEQGEPLAGANIVTKHTGNGTTANAKGQFTLKNINSNDIIHVTYIGYSPLEITVGEKRYFTLILQVAVNKLDEVHVLAYDGATTRRLSTGSISKVTSEEISSVKICKFGYYYFVLKPFIAKDSIILF